MRQLALDIHLADHAVFESFHAGPNALVVRAVRDISAGRGLRVVWLWGPPASGKSHLLQAAVAFGHGAGLGTGYLPLATLRHGEVDILDGMATASLIAIDDAEAVAGFPSWERRLLRLYEDLLAHGGRLLLAASAPPQQCGYALADLASRFAAAAVFRLERMADEDCLLAMQKRAAWRGLDLPDETAQFLLARVERSTASMFQLLDRLDRAALAAQRRLTIPFVRSVLQSSVGEPSRAQPGTPQT